MTAETLGVLASQQSTSKPGAYGASAEQPRLCGGDIIVRRVRNGYTVSVVHQSPVAVEYGDRYVTSDPAELARIIQQAIVTAALEPKL